MSATHALIRHWRRWAYLFAALAACATLLTAQLSASGAPRAATAAPVVTQMELSPAYAAGPVTARLSVTATQCVTTSRLIIAARNSAGANVDFGGPSGAVICPAGYSFSRAKTLPTGIYTVFGSWKDASGWHPLPAASLKVGPAASAPEPSPSPTTGSGPSWDTSGPWSLKFADDFSGTALNTSKWTAGWGGTGITGPVNTAENTCYSSSHVTVSGGLLHLLLTSDDAVCRGSTHTNTGAHINSDGKFSFAPRAAVEYRAYFPGTAGQTANWPALWDDGQSWPDDGENDTAEGLGGQLCTNWWGPGGDSGADCQGAVTGWHTVGYSWASGMIKWYYDGRLVTTKSTSVTSPHYLILQNTQGDYGGPTLTPSDLQVDWVRVWG